jgi:hypothetical protein
MICTLTARRLRRGSYEEFRQAWDVSGVLDDDRPNWTRIYHCRDVADPDVVLSFGLFDGTLEELRHAQAEMGRDSQLDRVSAHVESVLLDGAYEVVERLER